jgi:DNA-directed RNA polymerase subunit M
MDFCPNCGTRLTSIRKKERRTVNLRLSCKRCGYEKSAAHPVAIVPKIEYPHKECVAVIEKKEQKLRTLPTVRIGCPRCGNNLAYAWQVHLRRLEESSTQFFRCTKCSGTFREDS